MADFAQYMQNFQQAALWEPECFRNINASAFGVPSTTVRNVGRTDQASASNHGKRKQTASGDEEPTSKRKPNSGSPLERVVHPTRFQEISFYSIVSSHTNYLASDNVTIEVGSENVKPSAPGVLLESGSPVFRTALDGDFDEGRNRVIHLPDQSPETVGIFVGWI